MDDLFMQKGATFSECSKYRYSLTRIWDESIAPCVFICLNPSTADASNDDPTVRRCIRFARAWECGGFVMLNLFAYRATDPNDMLNAECPVGEENDKHIIEWTERAGVAVAAWGHHGCYLDRDIQVASMVHARCQLMCLGLTKDGHPRHPLYMPKSAPLSLFGVRS